MKKGKNTVRNTILKCFLSKQCSEPMNLINGSECDPITEVIHVSFAFCLLNPWFKAPTPAGKVQ